MKLALPLLLALATPASAQGILNRDAEEARNAHTFVLFAEVKSGRESYMVTLEFHEAETGAANESACWSQSHSLTRRFGRMGWAVTSDCVPKMGNEGVAG